MATGADTPLLLCYDGSDPAKHAIERAADLLRIRRAVVLSVWQPTAVLGSFAWAGATESMLNYVELDRAAAELAERIASEGARVAQDAGMQAEPLAVKATGPVWKTILEIADEPRCVDDRDRFAGAHRPALDAAGERFHRCRPSCRPTDACHPLPRRRRRSERAA